MINLPINDSWMALYYRVYIENIIHMPIGGIFLKANVPGGCPQNDLSEDSNK